MELLKISLLQNRNVNTKQYSVFSIILPDYNRPIQENQIIARDVRRFLLEYSV